MSLQTVKMRMKRVRRILSYKNLRRSNLKRIPKRLLNLELEESPLSREAPLKVLMILTKLHVQPRRIRQLNLVNQRNQGRVGDPRVNH
jgi:hypothetical protein